MTEPAEVVITGIGVVSPIGIGKDRFWNAIRTGRSGVRRITLFDTSALPIHFGGEISDFDPKQYVTPRKSLKVMARDIQLGVSAARLAAEDAGLGEGSFDPQRCGVLMGSDMIQCHPDEIAMAFRRCFDEQGKFDFQRWGTSAMDEIYPLWMLKHLPNMPACHVAIAHDARGPNNTIALGEVSSLLAVAEACRVLERGQADVMFAGGTGSRVHPTIWVRSCAAEVSHRNDQPEAASRPFDADRDGWVNGEGAAVFMLETRRHATARRAPILAHFAGAASRYESPGRNGSPMSNRAIRDSITAALHSADATADEVSHVNAHGLGGIADDRREATAIRETLGDVPVTAPKSFFGNLGSGTGAVELAASVLALQHGVVPRTLNYERPDPHCPIQVVHDGEQPSDRPLVLALNQAPMGQAVALAIRCAE